MWPTGTPVPRRVRTTKKNLPNFPSRFPFRSYSETEIRREQQTPKRNKERKKKKLTWFSRRAAQPRRKGKTSGACRRAQNRSCEKGLGSSPRRRRSGGGWSRRARCTCRWKHQSWRCRAQDIAIALRPSGSKPARGTPTGPLHTSSPCSTRAMLPP